jgi:16S rRNA G527 N7-methylase RsmG
MIKTSTLFPKLLSVLTALLLGVTMLVAHAEESDKEKKEDIQRHRAMASAHEAAAKCIEAGKKEDVCVKELQAACKGLAVGKYCGLKHVH